MTTMISNTDGSSGMKILEKWKYFSTFCDGYKMLFKIGTRLLRTKYTLC
jgi:hypothetical protein